MYLPLLGAIACGPSSFKKEPTIFRIDTDECRITQAETPWLDIEIRYGGEWTARGRYISSTGAIENVQHSHQHFGGYHDETQLYGWTRRSIVQCAENDPLRENRPVGFVVDESSFR